MAKGKTKIHHTQKARAERMGVALSVSGDLIEAFWPERALKLTNATASGALDAMEAEQAIRREQEADGTEGEQNIRNIPLEDEFPPDMVQEVIDDLIGGELGRDEDGSPLYDEIERSENGVPLDGTIAYEEGFAAADCPFSSDEDEEEYERFTKWNEDWDAAADEAEPEPTGSVVKEKYRAIYAERGHPAHCGDWLAEILNNLCLTKEGIDIGRFMAVMEANDVNMSKYKTSGNGWQGRYRMTGRNLLAKKLFTAEHLNAPNENGEMQQYPVPADWKAAPRFK